MNNYKKKEGDFKHIFQVLPWNTQVHSKRENSGREVNVGKKIMNSLWILQLEISKVNFSGDLQ